MGMHGQRGLPVGWTEGYVLTPRMGTDTGPEIGTSPDLWIWGGDPMSQLWVWTQTQGEVDEYAMYCMHSMPP